MYHNVTNRDHKDKQTAAYLSETSSALSAASTEHPLEMDRQADRHKKTYTQLNNQWSNVCWIFSGTGATHIVSSWMRRNQKSSGLARDNS